MSLPWVMDYSPSPISIEWGRVDGICLPKEYRTDGQFPNFVVRNRVGGMSLPWVMDYSPSPISIEWGRVGGVGLPWVMDCQPSPTSVERGRVDGVCLPKEYRTDGQPARRAAG